MCVRLASVNDVIHCFHCYQCYRDVGDGLSELCCTLPIDADILNYEAPVPYKYVIYSSRSEENEKPHEILYGADGHGDVVNRCLVIPNGVHPGGMHLYACVVIVWIFSGPHIFIQVIISSMTTWLTQKQRENHLLLKFWMPLRVSLLKQRSKRNWLFLTMK